jgi:hypothetical protein
MCLFLRLGMTAFGRPAAAVDILSLVARFRFRINPPAHPDRRAGRFPALAIGRLTIAHA